MDCWLAYNFLITKSWKRRWERQNEEDKSVDAASNSWLSGWRNHVLIEGGNKVACLQCGRFGADKKNYLGVLRCNWAHQSCLGCKRLPKGLRQLIEAGCFDGSLDSLSNELTEKAAVYLEAAGLSVLGGGGPNYACASGRPPG